MRLLGSRGAVRSARHGREGDALVRKLSFLNRSVRGRLTSVVVGCVAVTAALIPAASPASASPVTLGVNVPAEEWIYNVPVNQTVATFAGPNLASADYTATINWGDGTNTYGTVSGSGGNYSVAGTHTYISAPAYLTLSVSITDTQGDSGGGSATAIIDTDDNGTLIPATITPIVNVP